MFHFLIAAESAKKLADDLQAFPYRGPVHDRIIAELRKLPEDYEDDGSGFSGPHVLCHIEPRDRVVLDLWAVDPSYGTDRSWVEDLKKGLADGGNL